MMFPSGVQQVSELDLCQVHGLQVARPKGWCITDNAHMVMLAAPNHSAFTILTGDVDLPWWLNPWQFVYDKLSEMQPTLLWVGAPKAVQACFGFASGWEFDCQYTKNETTWRGVVKCSVMSNSVSASCDPNYDHCIMVITGAFAQEHLWDEYAPWLPQVADHVQISDSHSPERPALQTLSQNVNQYVTALVQQLWHYRHLATPNPCEGG
jgi:hypothetical protein